MRSIAACLLSMTITSFLERNVRAGLVQKLRGEAKGTLGPHRRRTLSRTLSVGKTALYSFTFLIFSCFMTEGKAGGKPRGKSGGTSGGKRNSYTTTSNSSYLGCLGLSSSALQEIWIFPGEAPKCEYSHHGSQSGVSSSSGASSGGRSSSEGSSDTESSADGASCGSGGDSSSDDCSGNDIQDNGGDQNGTGGNINTSGGIDDSNGSHNGNDSINNNTEVQTNTTESEGGSWNSSHQSGNYNTETGNNSEIGSNDNENNGSEVNDGNGGNNQENGNDDGTGGDSVAADDEVGDDTENVGADDDSNFGDDQIGNGNNMNDGESEENDNNDGQDGQNSKDDDFIAENADDSIVSNEDFDNVNGDNGDGQSSENQSDDRETQGNNSGQGSESNPYADFDVSTCDTYENLWLWDLSLTCESENNLKTCECSFAQELLRLGILSCQDASLCPTSCSICSTCMRILGCITGNAELNVASDSSNIFLILAAVASVVVFGVVYYAVRKRSNPSPELNAHLMGAGPFPIEAGSPELPESQIWLAPIVAPAQFQPSYLAAVASNDSSFAEPATVVNSRSLSSASSDDNVWLAPVV